jgi:hypothetical protein
VRTANQIATDVLAAPQVPAALNQLNRADVEIGRAKDALAAHDYVGTFDYAKKDYNHVITAAIANVPVVASNDGRTLPPVGSEGGASGPRADGGNYCPCSSS